MRGYVEICLESRCTGQQWMESWDDAQALGGMKRVTSVLTLTTLQAETTSPFMCFAFCTLISVQYSHTGGREGLWFGGALLHPENEHLKDFLLFKQLADQSRASVFNWELWSPVPGMKSHSAFHNLLGSALICEMGVIKPRAGRRWAWTWNPRVWADPPCCPVEALLWCLSRELRLRSAVLAPGCACSSCSEQSVPYMK